MIASHLVKRWKNLLDRVANKKNMMAPSQRELLNEFYKAQDNIFMADLNSSLLGVWIGFGDPSAGDQSEAFDNTVRSNGGTVSRIGKFDHKKVKLVKFTHSNEATSTQIWVDPTYKSYRKAFEFYARQEFESITPALCGDFLNVDHVFNHSRAERLSLSFVRLALVDADINQMWGGEYESAATASSSGAVKGVRFATDLLLAKIFRIYPPLIDEKFEVDNQTMQSFVTELHRVGVPGPTEIISSNVSLALKKAKTGQRFRRICVADWANKIFYFNLDLPMAPNDKGPDWIKFNLRASGAQIEDLSVIQILDAKVAVEMWVERNFKNLHSY